MTTLLVSTEVGTFLGFRIREEPEAFYASFHGEVLIASTLPLLRKKIRQWWLL